MSEAQNDTVQGGDTILDVPVLRALLDQLGGDLPDRDLLRQVRVLEEVKNAISARQARATVELHRRQGVRDAARGIDRVTTARFVGSQVALARRRSPHLGSRLLGLAHALVEEMPHTQAALTAGVISEWDATAVCQQTACLTRQDRGVVDAALAADLGQVSHRRLVAAAQEHAYAADPAAFVARRARAENQRRVSLRPAPDCMSYLTGLLPVKDGVACYAALKAAAAQRGDQPLGQAMADVLVERLTGCTTTDAGGNAGAGTDTGAGGGGGVRVQVNLQMPIDTLTGDAPAYVPGYGPIPADLAREWVTGDGAAAAQLRTQIRRIFTYPGTGDIVGMDSRARTYPGLLAHLIRLRDQTCRTPYCEAPIAHLDHIRSHADGGPTSERNAQGACERCNYVKEHPDITVTGDAGQTTTSTGGLTATSHPPPPPGMPPPTRSPVERTLIDITWHHNITWHSP